MSILLKSTKGAAAIVLTLIFSAILLSYKPPVSSAQVGSRAKASDPSTSKPKTTATPKKKTAAPRTTRTNPPPSSTKDTAAIEMAYWDTIKNSNNPEDFKAYLRKYPNGEFIDLARNRLRVLEQAATQPTTTTTTQRPVQTTPSYRSTETSPNLSEILAWIRDQINAYAFKAVDAPLTRMKFVKYEGCTVTLSAIYSTGAPWKEIIIPLGGVDRIYIYTSGNSFAANLRSDKSAMKERELSGDYRVTDESVAQIWFSDRDRADRVVKAFERAMAICR